MLDTGCVVVLALSCSFFPSLFFERARVVLLNAATPLDGENVVSTWGGEVWFVFFLTLVC